MIVDAFHPVCDDDLTFFASGSVYFKSSVDVLVIFIFDYFSGLCGVGWFSGVSDDGKNILELTGWLSDFVPGKIWIWRERLHKSLPWRSAWYWPRAWRALKGYWFVRAFVNTNTMHPVYGTKAQGNHSSFSSLFLQNFCWGNLGHTVRAHISKTCYAAPQPGRPSNGAGGASPGNHQTKKHGTDDRPKGPRKQHIQV